MNTSDSAFAISPIDGRYHDKLLNLAKDSVSSEGTSPKEIECFSEFSLVKKRVEAECCYYIFIMRTLGRPLLDIDTTAIHNIYGLFNLEEYKKVKEIEAKTNHDVKAVEYYLRTFECFRSKSMIHFGLTSEDINSLSYASIVYKFFEYTWAKLTKGLFDDIQTLVKSFEVKGGIKTLSFTHGQAATPKLMSERMTVFSYRLAKILDNAPAEYTCKFGGSVGTLDAHNLVYPHIDWREKMDEFVEEFCGYLNLYRQQHTTQIDNYDGMTSIFQLIISVHLVLKDLCQDIWLLISKGYFKLRAVSGEVGSSAMPHKVNPIDFENAIGQIEISNALFGVLINNLPVSFLERDLRGSTMKRNIGVACAHSVLAIQGIKRGLGKLEVNTEVTKRDLLSNPQVLSEVVQTFLRSRDIDDSYERVLEFTRGKEVTVQTFIDFVNGLDDEELCEADKLQLVVICSNYLE